MPTLVVTFAFASDAQGFVAAHGTASTVAWTGAAGNPSGSLSSVVAGPNKSDDNSWTLSTTYEAIGVPPLSVVTGITATSLETRCTAFVSGTGCTSSALLTDGTLNVPLSAPRSFTAVDGAWVTANGGAATGVSRPSSNAITIKISNHLGTTSGGSGKGVTLLQDNLRLTITYRTTTGGGTSLGGMSLPSRGVTASPSGGFRLGGAPTVPRTATVTPSGGMARGGRSAPSVATSPPRSGGVERGGSAPPVAGEVPPTSGGVRRGGSLAPAAAYTVAASGGIRRGGVATRGGIIVAPATGGLRRGGVSSPTIGVSASGGMRRSGVAPGSVHWAPAATGGLIIGGFPVRTSTIGMTGTGGMRRGGIVMPVGIMSAESGGVPIGGAALVAVAYALPVSGGSRSGGSTARVDDGPGTASGGIAIGGHATGLSAYHASATGGSRMSGAARIANADLASGGMRMSARAPVSLGAGRPAGPGLPASGGISLGGAASLTFTQGYRPSGGLRRGGRAVPSYSLVVAAAGGMRISGGTATGVPDTFLAAMIAMLRGNATLVAAIGAPRVFSTWPGAHCPLPFVLVEDYVEQQPGEAIEHNTITVALSVYAASGKTARRDVGVALQDAMDTHAMNNRSNRSRLVWSDGVETDSWRLPTLPPVRLTRTGFGQDLYRWQLQYVFNIEPFFQE